MLKKLFFVRNHSAFVNLYILNMKECACARTCDTRGNLLHAEYTRRATSTRFISNRKVGCYASRTIRKMKLRHRERPNAVECKQAKTTPLPKFNYVRRKRLSHKDAAARPTTNARP